MKPTREQVLLEVKKLKEMKPKVRRYSAFGDDNHAAIEVEIRTLEKGLIEDNVYDAYSMSDSLLDSGLAAIHWRDGHEKDSPSENWSELVE